MRHVALDFHQIPRRCGRICAAHARLMVRLLPLLRRLAAPCAGSSHGEGASSVARIRSVHPGQWTDDLFVMVSPLARLLAIGVRNIADDNGVFEWNSVKLKMQLLPMDSCAVVELLAELVKSEQVYPYESGGKKFGIIRNFRRWQRPKKPKAYYPLPPEPFPGCDGLIPPELSVSFGSVSNPSGAFVVEESEKSGSEPKKAKRSGAARKTSAPESFQITEQMYSYAAGKGVADKARLEDVTEAFLQHHRAKGSRFVDWHAAWQGWVRREIEYKGKDAAQGGALMTDGDV